METKKIDRKVREALEIQRHQCSPLNGGINLDNGQFVKTKFLTQFLEMGNKPNPNRTNRTRTLSTTEPNRTRTLVVTKPNRTRTLKLLGTNRIKPTYPNQAK